MIRKFDLRGKWHEARIVYPQDLGYTNNNEPIPGVLAIVENFDCYGLNFEKKPCTLLLSLAEGKRDNKCNIDPYYEFAIAYDIDEDNEEYYVFYSSNPESCTNFKPEILKLIDLEIDGIKSSLDMLLREYHGYRKFDFRGKIYDVEIDYFEDRDEDDYGNSLDGLSITLGENREDALVDYRGKKCKLFFDMTEGSPVMDEDDELSQLPQYQFSASYLFNDDGDDDEEDVDAEIFYDSTGMEKYVSYGLFELSNYEIKYIKEILDEWFEEYKEMWNHNS